ncbi:hypothetical protein J1N35_025812 [Gossypium stocksii]|uniref:Glutamate synthase alpha subunit C-terminal domain-containing protein n=1 Tax=Gossypium stocksii TaxID=47602 RepID=A0A9D3V706_9ROSI|nr:hypothetical protein J1N35_025812 [Gossypium stocksii]
MNIQPIGEANDYVGKGMAEGEVAREHFAMSISLAQAMVKGTGNHYSEYMVGGCMVVHGKVGRNVVVQMTGGLAYMLDEDDTIIPKVNKEIMKI